MKFNIKFKIIALGAVLSILVTSAALILSSVQYRNKGKETQLQDIDDRLALISNDFSSETSGSDLLTTVRDVRDYVLEQYAQYPDDPDESLSREDKKHFYQDRFKWLYALEGISLYHMTDEESDFRNNYEQFIYILSDAKEATLSNSVYMGFVSENKTLFYLADSYSYRNINRDGAIFPGSRSYNYTANLVNEGGHITVNYKGKMAHATPVIFQTELLAYIFIEYDFNQVEADTISLVKTEAVVLSIASILMVIAFAFIAHFLLIKNITRLTKTSTEFSTDMEKGKKLEVKDPNIKSKDEIRELSNSFIALENGIINYIDVIQKETQEKERMNVELSVASNIQLSALPNNRYDDKNASIRAFFKSAKEVGGDFYDYFYLDANRLVIVISDVSGKGIPAALFMMKSKELIKSTIHENDNLVEAVKTINNTLTNNNKESLFVTSFIGVIDFSKSIITYVNAGHEKPYIVSNGKVKKLEGESNFVMGGMEDFLYKEESHPFNKGDYIFLFTDGLNESINKAREEFSYSRIEENLSNSIGNSLEDIINQMDNSLVTFVNKEEQFDDVTMLIVEYRDSELSLSYDKKDFSIITDIIDKFEEKFNYLPGQVKASTGIIIDELINNLVSYEKRSDLKIDISFKIKGEELEISIASNGEDYNPFDNHKEKYLDEFNPDIEEGGFGLSIIKDLSSSYKYEYRNKKAVTTINVKIK